MQILLSGCRLMQIVAEVKLPKSDSPEDCESAREARAKKLLVTARLVAEMEAALAQFSHEVCRLA